MDDELTALDHILSATVSDEAMAAHIHKYFGEEWEDMAAVVTGMPIERRVRLLLLLWLADLTTTNQS